MLGSHTYITVFAIYGIWCFICLCKLYKLKLCRQFTQVLFVFCVAIKRGGEKEKGRGRRRGRREEKGWYFIGDEWNVRMGA